MADHVAILPGRFHRYCIYRTDGNAHGVTQALAKTGDNLRARRVCPSGAGANAGKQAAPFAAIAAAMTAADNDGNGGDLYVAAGDYQESVSLKSRVSIYGGARPRAGEPPGGSTAITSAPALTQSWTS